MRFLFNRKARYLIVTEMEVFQENTPPKYEFKYF